MLALLKRRRQRKAVHAALRHARHLRHWREDLLSGDELSGLLALEAETRAALKQRNLDSAVTLADQLGDRLGTLSPHRSLGWIHENVEVILVAVAVAMGVRAYFIQPFKIPTGSMQKTLYGIHSRTGYHETEHPKGYKPNWSDNVPFRYAKWMLLGERYRVVRAPVSGYLERIGNDINLPSYALFVITDKYGNSLIDKPLRVPSDAADPSPEHRRRVGTRYDLLVHDRDKIQAGQVLWEGLEWNGDHVFVDKVSWNFRKPRRGDVSVFNTHGISGITPNTHYIKRMIAVPGEHVQIQEPHILVDGTVVSDSGRLAGIASTNTSLRGYHLDDVHGFYAAQLATAPGMWLYKDANGTCVSNQYFVLGDNTVNSRDGRYWGTVPEKNLVGPAFFVYWPFSRRWGPIR
jgi:signal peptidase I